MNTDSSTMEMDPDLARRLFKEGGTLIIAGIPVGTEFGIDLCTYQVGERFRGIKMIPSGPHFIFCAAQGRYGDSGPRQGFLHYFKSGEIVVREWVAQNEQLRERQISNPDLEKQRIRDNLEDLDRFLGAYDYRYLSNWTDLTNAITEDGIKRCMPENGIIRTNMELMSCPDSERPRGELSVSTTEKTVDRPSILGIYKRLPKIIFDENELLPNLKPIPGTAPKFTDLPRRVPLNSSPSDISKHHLDCIQGIDELIRNFEGNVQKLIEELQISFIMFLITYSVEALAHWRKALNLLSNSETAVRNYKLFYMKYLDILQHQLPHIPEELLEQNEKNTVYKDVRNLLANCMLNGLTVNSDKLMRKLKDSMKWEFDGLLDEDPEDLPVVVETV